MKLGQILGVDGLLLMEVVRTPQATNLMARLIAVKPGVLLLDEGFPWPLKDIAGWAPLFANHLNPFAPKLTVLAKDAIPISVVNLRSAVQSSEALETERLVKLLTIQRLSREPRFFVLEREKMQLLSEEKDLKLDDSAFWNGSHLLEGVVDQNGYSKETITINVRLAPPKGGAPVLFEVSGCRTNLPEVINRLAAKVNAALKINSAVSEWNAADEAAQYFNEAQWALRWGIYSEAQAAAESAWALGKHDVDCATIRIKVYAYATGRKIIGNGGYDKSTASSIEEADRDWIVRHLKKDDDDYPGIVYTLHAQNATTPINSLEIYNSPTPQSLEHAIRAMDLYRGFSQTLSASASHSAWHELGIDNLTMASEVLQHFYLVSKSQNGEADKLAELRALCRSVAAWISNSPEVLKRYKQCEMAWGCFWQEEPEDGVIFYRGYLTDPALDSSSFARFHEDIRARELDRPRLISWSSTDRKRAPIVWDQFVQELGNSTNEFLQAEAKVLSKIGFAGLNAEEIIPKYLEYWQGLAVKTKTDPEFVTTRRPGSDEDLFDQPGQILVKREQLFQLKAQQAQQQSEAARRRTEFERRIIYLNTQTNWNRNSFAGIMLNFDYRPDEAGELLPILTNYEARIAGSKQLHTGNMILVFEHRLQNIITPPWQKSVTPARLADRTTVQNNGSQRSPTVPPAPATNILFVNTYFGIPQEQFWTDVFVWPGEESTHGIRGEQVWSHSWQEGKLVLGVQYSCSIRNSSYAGENIGAAAIFDPIDRHWETVLYPRNPPDSRHEVRSLALFQGDIYLMDDESVIDEGNRAGHNLSIKKYDRKTAHWQTLEIQFPDKFEQKTVFQGPPQLFVVNNHLFAANFQSIFEITEDGHGTHILASTRRRPAATSLDRLDDLGSPVLFSGSNNTLRGSIGSKIYSWDGKDWQEIFDFGFVPQTDVFEDGVLFRNGMAFFPYEPPALQDRHYNDETLWLLQKDQPDPELCLYEKAKLHKWNNQLKPAEQPRHPFWKLPDTNSLISESATVYKSNLYVFVDHAVVTNVSDRYHWTVVEKDGCHAQLVCLSRDCPDPVIVPLKFHSDLGQLPLKSLADKTGDSIAPVSNDPQQTWLFFGGNMLYIGQKHTPGVWGIPIAELELAVTAQKQIQLDKKAQEAAQASAAAKQAQIEKERVQKNLLSQYDLNRNGIIDPDEKEAALDDPAFIASELDGIDANHNGWLDASELAYFDANTNKILEPKERTGIELAQHLLAKNLLKKFDASDDGFLDRQEFNELFQPSMATSIRSMPGMSGIPFPFPDDNRDGHIDLGELETFLKQQTRGGVRLRGLPGAAVFNQMRTGGNQPVDVGQIFKLTVEAYWQNPGGATNRPTLNNQERAGARSGSAGMPDNLKP
ncbi:MAG TPA: EF-hand domain-containing protein [Verrucomicrobiae bacterium]|nr:EF-hand domain-containing protein [Verrucomicrobiae bacterium]